MARRHRAEKRPIPRDARYGNQLVGLMVNRLMKRGKKSVAEGIVYQALEQLGELSKQDPVEVFEKALDNIKPRLEVKSRRVGGATYQVPIEVSSSRQRALAMRWIIQFSKARRGTPMGRAMAMEIMDAFNNQGAAVKKRDDTHKMAQANKAFAHYKW